MPNINKAVARRSSVPSSQKSNRKSKNIRVTTTDNKEKRASKVRNIAQGSKINKDLPEKKEKVEDEKKPLTVAEFI